jgi:uncharacterized Fe-S cluster protein YjdI
MDQLEESNLRDYSNDEITVHWDPKKCIHARECVKGLPEVFNRDNRPWVNISGASSEDIMKVIDMCPSGALSYERLKPNSASPTVPTTKADQESKGHASRPKTEIQVVKDGPLMVKGGAVIILKDGREVIKEEPFTLCRCGAAKSKPLCDGSHVKVGFKDS